MTPASSGVSVRSLPTLAVVTGLLLGGSASAGAPTDLVGMQQAYGWRTIATIVSTTASGDLTTAEAHQRLADLGLDRLRFPVRGHTPGAVLTACGFNDAVVCRLDLPAGSEPPPALSCARRGEHLLDVPLRLTVAEPPTAKAPGVAWVEDLQPCWRAGGTEVRVIPRPRPDDGQLSVEATGPAATQAIDRVRTHATLLLACGAGRLVWRTDADGRAEVVKIAAADDSALQPATQCAQDLLARVRLDGAVSLTARLPEP